MKSFFDYLFENKKTKKKQTPNQDEVTEISEKHWFGPDGRVINVTDSINREPSNQVHHLHDVVDYPERFDTSAEELKKIHESDYRELSTPKQTSRRMANWSSPIISHLAKKGFIRGFNYSYGTSKSRVHKFSLTDHAYSDEVGVERFIKPLKTIRKHILRTRKYSDDPISVKIYGYNETDPINGTHFDQELNSIEAINHVISSRRKSAERVIKPIEVKPQELTQTQKLGALGKTPPPGLTQAEWNAKRLIEMYYKILTKI